MYRIKIVLHRNLSQYHISLLRINKNNIFIISIALSQLYIEIQYRFNNFFEKSLI